MTLLFDRWPDAREPRGPTTPLAFVVRARVLSEVTLPLEGRVGLLAATGPAPCAVRAGGDTARLAPGNILHVTPNVEVLRVEPIQPERPPFLVTFAAPAAFVTQMSAFLRIDPDWTALLAGWPLPASPSLRQLIDAAADPELTPAEADELLLEAMSHVLRGLRARQAAARRLTGSASTVADLATRLIRARTHLDGRFSEALANREFARVAALSEHHFLRLFKTAFGTTVGRYRQARRLDEARRRIAEENRSVTEAALDVGYTSLSSFCRAFKARFGCAPSAVRSQRKPKPREPAPIDGSPSSTGEDPQAGTSRPGRPHVPSATEER